MSIVEASPIDLKPQRGEMFCGLKQLATGNGETSISPRWGLEISEGVRAINMESLRDGRRMKPARDQHDQGRILPTSGANSS